MTRSDRVSIYLNFPGTCEEAFAWYAEIFGSEVVGLMRMDQVPPGEGEGQGDNPPLSEDEKQFVMHAEVTILGGLVLMGTDMLTSRGHRMECGNNVTINLEPATLAETQRLFDALSDGGTRAFGLEKMFWDAYWGTCVDKFGVPWMFNWYESGS